MDGNNNTKEDEDTNTNNQEAVKSSSVERITQEDVPSLQLRVH